MLELSDIFTPLAGELGIGGVGGYLTGWALKKVAKLIAIICGLGFLSLQYLAYKGIISIDYSALRDAAGDLVGQASGLQRFLADIVAHAPFGVAFIGGFYLGFQRG
jgi:uncharacterized membrane protein (Fun14 family)